MKFFDGAISYRSTRLGAPSWVHSDICVPAFFQEGMQKMDVDNYRVSLHEILDEWLDRQFPGAPMYSENNQFILRLGEHEP